MKRMGNAGHREKGKSYFARRIWRGPNDTCTSGLRRRRGTSSTVTRDRYSASCSSTGRGTEQIHRRVGELDEAVMEDEVLEGLYGAACS